MNKNIVIFDLDGTLANIEHRLHHIQSDPLKANWDAFYEACDQDKPIQEMIEIMLALDSVGCFIWVVSGRSEAVRDKTLQWLRRHAIQPEFLLMRPANDYTPDDELKERWIKEGKIILADVMCVFEDRARVVEMWRRYGLRVLQVADGKF